MTRFTPCCERKRTHGFYGLTRMFAKAHNTA